MDNIKEEVDLKLPVAELINMEDIKRENDVQTRVATDDKLEPKLEKKLFSCALCTFQTSYRASINHHKETHLAPEERQHFVCAHCDNKYVTKTSLQYHINCAHTNSKSKELQKKMYRCSVCGHRTTCLSKVRQHETIHLAQEERQMFTCTHCRKRYMSNTALRRHCRNKHFCSRANESKGSPKKVYKCSICSIHMTRMTTLSRHMKVHLAGEEKQLYACPQCNKKCSTIEGLQCHFKKNHIDSRNADADCVAGTDKVILDNLKIEIDDHTPLLDDVKNAECLSVANEVKSEDFFKTEVDETPILNRNMRDDL